MKEQRVLTVNIRPGDLPGQKYTFLNEADESFTHRIPGDIIFKLVDKKIDDVFGTSVRRQNSNILMNFDVGAQFMKQKLFY